LFLALLYSLSSATDGSKSPAINGWYLLWSLVHHALIMPEVSTYEMFADWKAYESKPA